MKSLLRSPVVSAAIGGLTVAGVFLALGVTGRRTIRTVIGEAPVAAEPASETATGLTPNEIYTDDARGVVFVRAEVIQTVEDPFELVPEQQSSISTGSGFVIDTRGDILTNYHLIAGAGAGGISVEFEHGVTATARVVGEDANDDLAVLRVDPRGVRLVPLLLGNSATARVGDPTLAIGNPFGLDRTLTTGIVSALQRQITAPNGFAIDNVIQTDAPLNPGSSGGPLIDAYGRVIGVNSQIETGDDGEGSVGIGFAVPINTAKALLPRLEGAAAESPAYLGMAGLTINRSLTAIGVPARHGVLVDSVDPAGPAAEAGLRAGKVKHVLDGHPVYLGGDVIERIDGSPADTVGDVSKVVASKRPGQVIVLSVLRGRTLETIKVALGSGPTAS
jgi:S1-C subfamily serine protease